MPEFICLLEIFLIYFMLILLGLVVGFGSTLLGMGGSIFIIPILPIFVEISLKETIATGIFTVFFEYDDWC